MTLVHVSGPMTLPVSVAEARLHCRIDSHEEDSLVESYILQALLSIERATGSTFAEQTWRWHGDAFPAGSEISLEMGPVTAVASLTYLDAAGAEQILDPAEYRVDTISPVGRVIRVGSAWPGTSPIENAVVVEFTAGYSGTPEPVRMAILIMVASVYQDREGREDVWSRAVVQLVEPYRRIMI